MTRLGAADVLIVEDRASLRTMLRRTLSSRDYQILEAETAEQALRILAATRISVVLTDLKLPAASGMEVLHAAHDADPNIPVIMMTAYGTIEDAVAAMKVGAFDFLAKPVDTDHLLVLMERAVGQRRLLMENLLLKEEYAARYGFPEIIGEDQRLEEVTRTLQRAATSDTTVLLLGESGTGKELFARALHQLSSRKEGPFIAINCAAIPEALLENELFGHEKGAFTGATSRKLGKFELANGGTVLLDEMGELPLSLQSKLLRVLQERNFERVGGTQTITVDIRIVAATNRELQSAVEKREFRDDLYYRLSVFPISIPPLRERPADIPLLARHFVKEFCRELGRSPVAITDKCLQRLSEYDWPGNIRELSNFLERAVILCDVDYLDCDMVNPRRDDTTLQLGNLNLEGTLREVMQRAVTNVERTKILQVLEQTSGNRSAAATILGVSRKTLLEKIRKYDLVAMPNH